MTLRVGRVAAVHPEDNSVDLVMIDNGQRMPGVQVMSGFATTNTGLHDLPDVSTPRAGQWDLTEATDRDMMAVCGQVGGQLIVLGFLFPQICQMLFKDRNRRVMRHASDVYTMIDGRGNTEIAHPSGWYMRIGVGEAHEDLTGKDVDGKWKITKNTSADVDFTMKMGGNTMTFNVKPNGDIKATTQGKVQVDVSGTADIKVDGNTSLKTPQLTVDSPQSTFTGKVNVNGLLTFTQGMNGSGGGTGGGAGVQIDTDVHFINSHGITTDGGDVVAGTVSLQQHVHFENGEGNETNPPTP